MGKRRIIFIFLAILVTAGLAWTNYNSKHAVNEPQASPVVEDTTASEEPSIPETVPVV